MSIILNEAKLKVEKIEEKSKQKNYPKPTLDE